MMNPSHSADAAENPRRAKSIMALDEDEESCMALEESLDELQSPLYNSLNLESS